MTSKRTASLANLWSCFKETRLVCQTLTKKRVRTGDCDFPDKSFPPKNSSCQRLPTIPCEKQEKTDEANTGSSQLLGHLATRYLG